MMPLPRESTEDELRQTVVRLQGEITALCAQNTISNEDPTTTGVSHSVQRVESFYRVPKIPPFFKTDPAL